MQVWLIFATLAHQVFIVVRATAHQKTIKKMVRGAHPSVLIKIRKNVNEFAEMDDTNSKKQEERRIFDLVYGDKSFYEVKYFESPDFLVALLFRSTRLFWIVEITEYYY